MSSPAYIVLRPEASPEALVRFANQMRWQLYGEETRGHSRPAWRGWRPTPDSDVVWWEDHRTGVRFVAVSNAPPLVSEIGGLLPHWTREELLEKAAGTQLPQSLDALRALCTTEGETLSAEVRALLERWMRHEHQVVRRAVLHLCGLRGWPELIPAIQRRAESDPHLSEQWKQLVAAIRTSPS